MRRIGVLLAVAVLGLVVFCVRGPEQASAQSMVQQPPTNVGGVANDGGLFNFNIEPGNRALDVMPAPYLPGGSNSSAAPTASGHAEVTGLTGGVVYYITCDQTWRFAQGTSPVATSSSYGPFAANTHIRGRLGIGSTAVSLYNAGSSTASCSVSPEVP